MALVPPHQSRGKYCQGSGFLQGPCETSLGWVNAVFQDSQALALLTAEKQLFQLLEQLGALIQLLLEALGHVAIHVAGLQQLLKRLNHGAHMLTVNDTDVTAVLNLLSLKGEFPGLGLN